MINTMTDVEIQKMLLDFGFEFYKKRGSIIILKMSINLEKRYPDELGVFLNTETKGFEFRMSIECDVECCYEAQRFGSYEDLHDVINEYF